MLRIDIHGNTEGEVSAGYGKTVCWIEGKDRQGNVVTIYLDEKKAYEINDKICKFVAAQCNKRIEEHKEEIHGRFVLVSKEEQEKVLQKKQQEERDENLYESFLNGEEGF